MRFSRRIKRSPKSEPDDPPEFFKIYLPQHHSKKFLVPPDFLHNFNGEIPEKLKLKSLHGESWDVELEKVGNMLFMKKGWEIYVNDNGLEHGAFLVFMYDGNNEFTVKVFGINGCMKDDEIATTAIFNQQAEPEGTPDLSIVVSDPTTEVEKASQGHMPVIGLTADSRSIRFSKVDSGKNHYEWFISGKILKRFNITPPEFQVPEQIILRDHNGISQTAVIRQKTGPGYRVVISTGWREFYLNNKIHGGDELKFEIVLDEGRKIKEMILVNIVRNLWGRKNL